MQYESEGTATLQLPHIRQGHVASEACAPRRTATTRRQGHPEGQAGKSERHGHESEAAAYADALLGVVQERVARLDEALGVHAQLDLRSLEQKRPKSAWGTDGSESVADEQRKWRAEAEQSTGTAEHTARHSKQGKQRVGAQSGIM